MLTILWLHFIGDFILQNDKMALNKSKNLFWLIIHGIVYSLPFVFLGFAYMVITGILHILVDYISSKLTSYLWAKQERHWFFVIIGLDQSIHLTLLYLTKQYLL